MSGNARKAQPAKAAAPQAPDLPKILETLEAALDRKTYGGQILFFEPYERQREFFELGATRRERLLIAGNQNGKCISYRTPVQHPDGSSTLAGVLYERGSPFPVLSWDGNQLVEARATMAIKKPPEPVVRVWMQDGQWFECALNHRVLTVEGWRFVGYLLQSVPCLAASTSESGQSAQFSGARHWFEKLSGSLWRCFAGPRQCDAPLHEAVAAAQVSHPSAFGARRCSLSGGHLDGPASRRANSPCAECGRLASPGVRALALARSWLFLARDVRRLARRMTGKPRVIQQLSTVAAFGLRSIRAIFQYRKSRVSLVSPYASAGNQVVAYVPISSQPIYDFTVPKYGNYFAAGVIHHNTHAGGFEAALHMTGDYPAWWKGRRFDRPTKGWVAGETSLAVRDIQQKKLCGEPGVEVSFGTGMIAKAAFTDRPSMARGVTDAYDTIQVRHKSGGVSIARFKSYEQGRAKFQGESLDWVWFDEEPPEDVYAEGLTRTVATGGMAFMTFTPLKGRSSVVMRFLDEPSPDRGVVAMTIDDALHIPASERAKIIAGYLPHEREARARGVPMLGSGRIFLSSEEGISEPLMEYVPGHWAKLWGIDFGIGHPFAAVLILWDRDNDVIHVHHALRIADALPIMHAAAMKPIGAAAPVAWPRDGTNREHTSGETLAAAYKRQGLVMLSEHATWPDGGVSTEAGVLEMDERMRTGRFKVARQLSEWFEEYRFYHRKDGQIVKIKDDIMSATRIAVMQKRSARAVNLGGHIEPRRGDGLATGLDFPLF